MKGTLKKLLVGTSVAVGMSAISAPAMAASLTNVQFSDSNFRTYNGTTMGDISDGVVSEGKSALEDSSLYTNVELGISEGTTTSFTGTLGSHDVKVEGVTANDWENGGLASQWIGDFKEAYPTLANNPMFASSINTLGAAMVQRAGDPNVSSFTQDDATGEFTFTTVGHYNILAADWIQSDSTLAMGAGVASSLLGGAPLQMSEIAKVTIDGQVEYVYDFSADMTGVVAADDGVSHSGLYSKTFSVGTESESVPEPSVLLGLAAFGGLFAASKRKNA